MKASNMRTPDEKKENLVHSHTENWLYSGSRYVDIQNGGNKIRSHAHDTHIAEFCVEPMAQQWHTASSVCIFFTDLPGKREHQTKNREKSGAEKWTHKQLIYRCEASWRIEWFFAAVVVVVNAVYRSVRALFLSAQAIVYFYYHGRTTGEFHYIFYINFFAGFSLSFICWSFSN